MIEEHRDDESRIQLVPRRTIETVYVNGVHLPAKRDVNGKLVPVEERGLIEHKPKKPTLWGKTKNWFGKKSSSAKDKGKIAWRNKGKAINTSIAATKRAGKTAANFGYSLPGPFQVWTLAWQKTTKALKWLTLIVFALVLFFVPIGVFWYTGWAVGAAFMFLVSLIYWVFTNLFNGIAYVIVSFINGIVTLLMNVIIWMVESVLGLFMNHNAEPKHIPNPDPAADNWIYVDPNYWTEGHQLLHGSLIKYNQIANVPSLMLVSSPGWESWMNEPIFSKLFNIFGISLDLSWLAAPIREFYSNLAPAQAVAVGLCIIAIPIVFLIVVYWRNRHLSVSYTHLRAHET